MESNRGNLIAALQKAQETHGYLSKEVIKGIAEGLGVTPAKAYGVATFYAQFRHSPAGKHHIHLCQGTACHVNGSAAIGERLREYLGVEDGGTTEDGLFTLSDVACLGCCSLSPAMMIGGAVHGSLTPASAEKIISGIKRSAT